jgi:predicted YcjX-like family ATPase
MTERAIGAAKFSGAQVDVIALAAVRATREATVARGRESLPAIIGTPFEGQTVGREAFDGAAEVASFPGDLPEDPAALLARNGFKGLTAQANDADFRFLRFRPPATEPGAAGAPTLPHIRLDRALQFLLGDRLA